MTTSEKFTRYEFTNEETKEVWERLCATVTGNDWANERNLARTVGRLANGDLNGKPACEQLGELLWRKFRGTFQSANIYWYEIAQAALLVTDNEN